VIAAILDDPGPHAGKAYLLDGPAEMDAAEMAAALRDALGRPIKYYDLPISDFQAAAAAIPHLGSHVGQHIGAVMIDLQNGLLAGTTDTVEQLTGTAPMSVHDFVVANRELFKPGHPSPRRPDAHIRTSTPKTNSVICIHGLWIHSVAWKAIDATCAGSRTARVTAR
jgi:hypothetical protein